MKLRLLAREDAVAYVPGAPRVMGQPPSYIGRKHVVAANIAGKSVGAFPATKEGSVVEVEPGSALFCRYQKLASRGDVWPGDLDTAQALGVEFPAISFADGTWVRADASTAPADKEQK